MKPTSNIFHVTVLITFYAKEHNILIKAIQSVLSQTYQNISILIIDDCSPISASDELVNIDTSKITIVRNEYNIGMCNSINKGLSLIKTNLVAFLDYDDEWYPNKLALQLALLENNNNNKAVIYSQAEIISRDTSYLKPKRCIKENERVSAYLFEKNGLMQTSSLLLYTETALSVKMANFRRHTDYQFCLALENFGCKFYMVAEPTYKHIIYPKIIDYTLSIEWLKKNKEFMSESSIISFKKNIILRLIIANKQFYTALIYAYKNKLIKHFIPVLINYSLRQILPLRIQSIITNIKNK